MEKNDEALPGVLGNGKMAFISGEQRPHFEGNRGTKTILGNKQNFDFRETGEQANLFKGNKGTGTNR